MEDTQSQTNQPPLPQPQPTSTPPASAVPPPGQKLNLSLDPRTMETLKASALWNAVSHAISNIFSHMSLFFIGGALGQFLGQIGGAVKDFPVGEFVQDVFWGAVFGALIGFCISKYFSYIQQWNREYLKGRLNSFFKLLFYPSIAISLLFFMMTSVLSFAIGFMPLIVIGIGIILSSFVYAKMMAKKVGQLYPPTV